MNREMKRAQAKAERQQKAAGTDRRSAPAATTKRASVQEKKKPCSVGSHLQTPCVKLKQHTVMPFCMTLKLHMPPVSIAQRFCTMLVASLSSQEQ